jgi:hypothetical protein
MVWYSAGNPPRLVHHCFFCTCFFCTRHYNADLVDRALCRSASGRGSTWTTSVGPFVTKGHRGRKGGIHVLE